VREWQLNGTSSLPLILCVRIDGIRLLHGVAPIASKIAVCRGRERNLGFLYGLLRSSRVGIQMAIETIDSKPLYDAHVSNKPATRSTQPTAAETTDARMRHYAEVADLPFLEVDIATGAVLSTTDPELLPILPSAVLGQLCDIDSPSIVDTPSGLVFYALPLPQSDSPRTVAVGYVLSRPDVRPQDVVLAAAEQGWSEPMVNSWLEQRRHCSPDVLQQLLRMVFEHTSREVREARLEGEIDQLSQEIDQTYEEISLLHALTQNLQISRSPVELARLCLQRMRGLVRASGNVIWLEDRLGERHFLVEGRIPFDEDGAERLLSRFQTHRWPQPLVRNNIVGTLLGTDFPGLDNLIIVPIAEGEHRAGWILNCNHTQGLEFGTVEASLANSIATILGTHLRNIDLYHQHEELLVGFVRSMVSALDAKDEYTRGHSERVALVARRLGQEFDLSEESLQDIYLAGLLHDLGKIGLEDGILQKPGRLTDEEFAEVQRHPARGDEILKELVNLRDILPGVRNHHEKWTGGGYPDGLVGEEIPFIARVLAVADSFDAMASSRPYREGMPIEKIEGILRDGSGTQWDPKVIQAYFTAQEDILRQWTDAMENTEDGKRFSQLQPSHRTSDETDDASRVALTFSRPRS
jgi:HD-GYP domain-containing protein (c-di-GMP phosphodiesterase class II)